MPKDYSNTRCNNCRAYGHLKKACPLRGVPASIEAPIIDPSSFHKKIQEPSKKDVSNSTPPIAYLGGLVEVCSTIRGSKPSTSVSTAEGMKSNNERKKNFSFKNLTSMKKYSPKEDSDSDESLNLKYCSICETNEHDDMECLRKEALQYFYECDLRDKYIKEQKEKKSQRSKEGECKILFLTEQNPALAPYHECDLCDESGHFEYDCPLFIKAKEEQDDYDKNWRQKWGKKIQKNKKLLQSASKQSESGMQCQYCYSIHQKTEFCFLAPYEVKEGLRI